MTLAIEQLRRITQVTSDNTYYLRRNQLYRFKGKLSTITGKSKL